MKQTPIGGYIEPEFPDGRFVQERELALNSTRHCGVVYGVRLPADLIVPSEQAELTDFIKSVDHLFTPALSCRVRLADYAEKMLKKATLYTARVRGEMVAVLAAYVNDDVSYITLICVLPGFQRMGIAEHLMQGLLHDVSCNGGMTIQLEVSSENGTAIRLYEKFGFRPCSDTYKIEGVSKVKLIWKK